MKTLASVALGQKSNIVNVSKLSKNEVKQWPELKVSESKKILIV